MAKCGFSSLPGGEGLGSLGRLEPTDGLWVVRSMLSSSFRAQHGSVPTNLITYQIQNLENQRTAYAA